MSVNHLEAFFYVRSSILEFKQLKLLETKHCLQNDFNIRQKQKFDYLTLIIIPINLIRINAFVFLLLSICFHSKPTPTYPAMMRKDKDLFFCINLLIPFML